MKRLFVLALVTAGLAAGVVPAQAAPYCGPQAGVRCTPDGSALRATVPIPAFVANRT